LRFSAFLIPISYFCFEQGHAAKHRSWGDRLSLFAYGAGGLGVVVLTLLVTHQRFSRARRSDKDFGQVLAMMRPDKKILGLVFDEGDIFRIQPPYLHFGAWYQASKLGESFPSFAYDPPAFQMPVRYRGTPWSMPSVWNPSEFNWKIHEGWRYDYFLVRSQGPRPALFRDAGPSIELIAQRGAWLLYGRTELRGRSGN
jgi:hypothetical protein